MRSLKKRGPHVLDDLNDLLFSLQAYHLLVVLFNLGLYFTLYGASELRMGAP